MLRGFCISYLPLSAHATLQLRRRTTYKKDAATQGEISYICDENRNAFEEGSFVHMRSLSVLSS